MAIFSLAQRTTATTSGAQVIELIAGANNAYSLKEVGLTIAAATASVVGLGQPAAKGTTPTSVVLLAEDQGNTTTGASSSAISWSTAPTIPTNFSRRVSLPATIGCGIVWTFPRGINVLKTVTQVLTTIIASSAMDVWWVVDE